MSRKLFYEEWALIATIDPQDGNAVDPSTDEIDMSKWEEVVFVLLTGLVAASGTCDFKIREANTSGGTFSDISGKAITQLTATSDNIQTITHLLPEELSAGYRYVKGVMDNSAHSQLVGVVAFGRAKYQPSSDNDLASVVEIVL